MIRKKKRVCLSTFSNINTSHHMQIDIDLKRPIACALALNAAQQQSEREQELLLDATHHVYDELSRMPAQFTLLSTGESNLSAFSPNKLSAAILNLSLAGGPISRLVPGCLGRFVSIILKQTLLQCQASEHDNHTSCLVLFNIVQLLLAVSSWHQFSRR